VRASCVARKSGRIAEFPAPRAKKELPLRKTTWFVYRHDGKVLLERRPSPGIWGGLWCFPEKENPAARSLRKQKLAPIDHGFTHFRLRIQPLLCEIKTPKGDTGFWLDTEEAQHAAIPTPVKKLLQQL
jgi:A/G-specific adenine glycosylase